MRASLTIGLTGARAYRRSTTSSSFSNAGGGEDVRADQLGKRCQDCGEAPTSSARHWQIHALARIGLRLSG
jgi:hypothetical protein